MWLLLNYFRSKYCEPVALPQEEYEFEREELWLKSNFWSVYVSVLSELSQCELFTSGVVISSVHCTFYIVHYMLYKQTHNIHTAVHTCVWPIFHVNADVIVCYYGVYEQPFIHHFPFQTQLNTVPPKNLLKILSKLPMW